MSQLQLGLAVLAVPAATIILTVPAVPAVSCSRDDLPRGRSQ